MGHVASVLPTNSYAHTNYCASIDPCSKYTFIHLTTLWSVKVFSAIHINYYYKKQESHLRLLQFGSSGRREGRDTNRAGTDLLNIEEDTCISKVAGSAGRIIGKK